jgi:hypothetical protein
VKTIWPDLMAAFISVLLYTPTAKWPPSYSLIS